MLTFRHDTAWEGDDRDVILGNFCCQDPYLDMNHVSKYPRGLGTESPLKLFYALCATITQCVVDSCV